VLKLPAQWDQQRLKKLLAEQQIVYQSVKKKAGKWCVETPSRKTYPSLGPM
jgi:hypothetical protein